MRAPAYPQPQVISIPLAYGLRSKVDPRALPPPDLTICRDVQFDEEGGLQTRLPLNAFPMGIVGGGTLSAIRKLDTYQGELLCWTSGALYSWSERDGAWVLRQEYLAPKIEEEPVFVRSQDQVFADRAELGGAEVTVWVERDAAGDVAMIGARDVATGAILIPPTSLGSGAITTPARPRVLPLATGFVVIVHEPGTPGNLKAIRLATTALTSAGLATALGAPVTVHASVATGPYDAVVRNGTCWVVSRTDVSTYRVVTFTDAMSMTGVNKAANTSTRLALAITADGANLMVVRFNTANEIRGDRLNPTTLADVAVNTLIETPGAVTINQLTCAFRSVATGGQFRCYIFWSENDTVNGTTNASTFVLRSTFIDTANAVGASGVRQVRRMALASRAFDRGGRVFVWTVFAMESAASGMGEPLGLRAAFQNTYYLYRDGETVADVAIPYAKAAVNIAGGYHDAFNLLPGVQNTSGDTYAFAGLDRRIVVLSDDGSEKRRAVQTGYADRGPRVVRLTFDSNEARRTVELGRTLYVTGGIVSQYDGEGIVEVGFHVYPWLFTTAAAAGALGPGTYNYKSTESWPNAAGDFDRSTTATGTAVALAASQATLLSTSGLYVTAKKGARPPVALEFWRQIVNAPIGADFHLVTSNDPAATGANGYIKNDPALGLIATFTDNLSDTALLKREKSPENGGVLARLAPPPATIVAATQDRVLLAGVAGQPNRLSYSLLRAPDEVAAWNEICQLDLPADGGAITALSLQSETIYAFKERALFALPGDGHDNLGLGENYGPARLLAADVGAVSQETVALTPKGTLFKSQKGWYLQAGWSAPVYIGGPVAAFDEEPVIAVHVLQSQHQVRIVTDARVLVWDYQTNAERGGTWGEWTPLDNVASVIWQGQHVLVTNGGDLRSQAASWAAATGTAGMDVETAWIVPPGAEPLGSWHAFELMVLGEHRGPHRLRVRLSRNYDDSAPFDDRYWTPSPATVGRPFQVRIRPPIAELEALKVRITAEHASINDTPPAGESCKLTKLALSYGVRPDLFRGLPAAQTQ